MKKIAIIGSTGSVGQNALCIIEAHKEKFKVVGLTANTNVGLLGKQVNMFKPRIAAIGEKAQYGELKKNIKKKCKILLGRDGISHVAQMKDADMVIIASSGSSGLFPLIAAIKAKKQIALANKESIVSAGDIVMRLAKKMGVKIIPIDSEHNSIFQCIMGEDKKNIKKIFLMGTGGPLLDVPRPLFGKLKPRQVLAHPVWKMGKKITVDSATMMNKGLEIIEASHLFEIDSSKISVLIHREAIIHSMVEFADGNIMANLFVPDMKMPIFYALNYPKRQASRMDGLNFLKIKKFSFEKPDYKKFPSLGICYKAAASGGTYPAALTSANEEAVSLYLAGKIGFTDIIKLVEKVLSRHKSTTTPSLRDIFYTDKWAKEETKILC
ncbi:MAG: 1-deoxy-D-xylulose-5-phosphate reductoisomerase [Candidatus Omnitrophota bacterium]